MKKVILFIILGIIPIIGYGTEHKIIIDWGDNSKLMIIEKGKKYKTITIIDETGKSNIYYHPSWVENGKIIHWLNNSFFPQHKYKSGGNFNVKISKFDKDNNLLSENNFTLKVPDVVPIPLKSAGIKPPSISYPMIFLNGKKSEFVLPGKKFELQCYYSFKGISDPENYKIRLIKWYFVYPWQKIPEDDKLDKYNLTVLKGFKVTCPPLYVPSSKPTLNSAVNDRYANIVKIRMILNYIGETIGKANVNINGKSVPVVNYQDYYVDSPWFPIPVKDMEPPSDDFRDVRNMRFSMIIKNKNSFFTGNTFPDGIKIIFKDDNPHLNPNNLSCKVELAFEKVSGSSLEMFPIATINFNAPHAFGIFPDVLKNSINITGPDNFGVLAAWDKFSKYILPLSIKGKLRFYITLKGFGPGTPTFPGKYITIYDNKRPNIYIKIKSKNFEKYYTTNECPPATATPVKTSNNSFEFHYINNKETWKNSTGKNKLIEDARYNFTIYAIDNVKLVNNILPADAHIKYIEYQFLDPYGKIIKKALINKGTNKLEISDMIFHYPGNYKLIVDVTDNASKSYIINEPLYPVPDLRRRFILNLNIENARISVNTIKK